jgi:hypothetical protein
MPFWPIRSPVSINCLNCQVNYLIKKVFYAHMQLVEKNFLPYCGKFVSLIKKLRNVPFYICKKKIQPQNKNNFCISVWWGIYAYNNTCPFDPSGPPFPLIVSTAKWTTPQIFEAGDKKLSHLIDIRRQRAASVQIPFMGHTIIPANKLDINSRMQIRRRSLPAHHTISERYL